MRCLRWPNFAERALTLSYDDGVVFDRRLIEIMDKHGIKGTFNLNSGLFAKQTGARNLTEQEAYDLYANSAHEVAVHGVKHLYPDIRDDALFIKDIVDDRVNLERLFNRVVRGMAYAFGANNDCLAEDLARCGINYARTTVSTEKFDVPENWLRMPATCHHNNPRLMQLCDEFLAENKRYQGWRTIRLFYLWGHSYEFNDKDNWHVIEEFCEKMGNRDDIWYATNGEIYEYIKASERLQFSLENKFVYNPSAIDVYLYVNDKNVIAKAGETTKL